jgi:hypothetical protein
MRNDFILQQHMPYVQMISKALDFSESMLIRSTTLYPFAVCTTRNEINCVLLPSEVQFAQTKMIEALQAHMESQKGLSTESASLLVYDATVDQGTSPDTQALVFTITDTQGHNSVIMYSYRRSPNGIIFGQPFTCDFSD